MVSYGANRLIVEQRGKRKSCHNMFSGPCAEMGRNLVLGIYAHIICLKTPTKPSAFVFFPSGNASPAWNP